MAGIDLSDHEGAYTMLTGRVCGEPIRAHDPPRNYVTPGSAAYSTLMYQLRGEDRDVMPPDMPLPNAEIVLIGHWIDEGATCE